MLSESLLDLVARGVKWVVAEFLYWLSLRGKVHASILLIWLVPSALIILMLSLFFVEYTEKSKLQSDSIAIAKGVQSLLDQGERDTVTLGKVYEAMGPEKATPIFADYLRSGSLKLGVDNSAGGRTLYSKVVVIDENQTEVVKIINNEVAPAGTKVDVATNPAAGDRERLYYEKAKQAGSDGLYVSHLERLYAREKAPMEMTSPENFHGSIVFGKLLGKKGTSEFGGVILAYLDFIHIIETVRHFDAVKGTVSSWDYDSGSYAALIDDQGWFIAHPRISHLRGFDEKGEDLAPLRSDNDIGNMPMRVQLFEEQNSATRALKRIYDALYLAMQKQKNGTTKYANLSGQPRLLAYSVIKYDKGEYQGDKVFGGVWVGKRISFLNYLLTYPTLYFDDLNAIPYAIALTVVMILLIYLAFKLSSLTGLLGFINSQSAKNRQVIFRDLSRVDLRGATAVVLYCDIINFAKLCESYAWNMDEIGQYVNTFYSEMTDIITSKNGIICNKFNDQIVAAFGAFQKTPANLKLAAEEAVQAALQMRKKFQETAADYNALLVDGETNLGIGIRTGPMLIGNVSGKKDERFSYTAIGSTVSLVMLEEHLSHASDILIDKNTYALLSADLKEKHKGKFVKKQLKGGGDHAAEEAYFLLMTT